MPSRSTSTAANVVATLDMPFDFDVRRLDLDPIVGAAVGVPVHGSGEHLVARTDAILYQAKCHGRERGRFAIAGEAGARH